MTENKGINLLIEYCKLVAAGKASVERFPPVTEDVLP
jgi:hypothetical protein